MISKLEESRYKISEPVYKPTIKNFIKFLKKEKDNQLIIDYKFGKYIRDALNRGKPLIASFNWTTFFKRTKTRYVRKKEIDDPINGDDAEHVVVIYRYSKKSVFICDSHYKCYKYKLKKYRQGFYSIPWEIFMTIMGRGDVIIPERLKS